MGLILAVRGGVAWRTAAIIGELSKSPHVDAPEVATAVFIVLTRQTGLSEDTALCDASEAGVLSRHEGLLSATQVSYTLRVQASRVCPAERRAVSTALTIRETLAAFAFGPARAGLSDVFCGVGVEPIRLIEAEMFNGGWLFWIAGDGERAAVLLGPGALSLCVTRRDGCDG
jgi:hypothetical protein